ncbi:MAG: hypothetical protein VX771_10275 [Pseudomonadota bacterium]|nr:hypothetical protein [Pseudomonadota bacterium]
MKNGRLRKKLNQPIQETVVLGKQRSLRFIVWFGLGATGMFWVGLCYHLGFDTGTKATAALITIALIAMVSTPKGKVKFKAVNKQRESNSQ